MLRFQATYFSGCAAGYEALCAHILQDQLLLLNWTAACLSNGAGPPAEPLVDLGAQSVRPAACDAAAFDQAGFDQSFQHGAGGRLCIMLYIQSAFCPHDDQPGARGKSRTDLVRPACP